MTGFFFFSFSETRFFQFKKWQMLEKKMAVFPRCPTSTCRSHQTCFYGYTFCICPAWDAYYACLKHINFICHLIAGSYFFFFLYFPCRGHAKKGCTQKNVNCPSPHISFLFSAIFLVKLKS